MTQNMHLIAICVAISLVLLPACVPAPVGESEIASDAAAEGLLEHAREIDEPENEMAPSIEREQALQQTVEEGFTPLFNGKDLDGWLLVFGPGTTKGYRIEDGTLICPADGGGDLLTVREYADFILRFEFRTEPGGNNGIIIRAPIEGRPAYDGMEIQILDHGHKRYEGWLQPWQRHGSVYGIAPAMGEALKPAGEWNREEIAVRGPHIVVTLNGTVINDADLSSVTDPKVIAEHPGMLRTSGRIGFHGHASHVEFRNIRIRDLTVRD